LVWGTIGGKQTVRGGLSKTSVSELSTSKNRMGLQNGQEGVLLMEKTPAAAHFGRGGVLWRNGRKNKRGIIKKERQKK